MRKEYVAIKYLNVLLIKKKKKTKTSVIASMLASGYILSQDVVGKAAEIDRN